MAGRPPWPGWARDYQRGMLRGDLLAGVTVSAYLIPQVMAYAEVAGLPAVAGIWASVGALVAYALLGSSPQPRLKQDLRTVLLPTGLIDRIGEENVFPPCPRRSTPTVGERGARLTFSPMRRTRGTSVGRSRRGEPVLR